MSDVSAEVQVTPAGAPRLRRVLSLWDLILYGVVSVTPSAPVTVFGLAMLLSRGHALDTILIAMVAMLFTAFSYGRMAAIYPSAGSAYAYVGRGLSPHLGFMAGWAMLLSYLIIPLFCVIYGSLCVQRLFPQVPYVAAAVFFAGGMTFLNLRGIRATARANEVILAFMCTVLVTFIALAIRYLLHNQGWTGLLSFKPFYNPQTFDVHAIASATSFAALTYIGFDAVTTLAEEVKNPKRNVLLATVFVCLFTGIFGGLLVYLGQLIWPDYHTFPNIETAFMDVTRRAGGPLLFQAMTLLLVVANIGSGLTGHAGGARLLYGMGRDKVLPHSFFGYLDPKRSNPTYNIWLIGILAFGFSLVMNYQLTAEILNFGAFLGFMGVNLAAMKQLYFSEQRGRKRRFFSDALIPALGFLFCLGIWWNLPRIAKIVGTAWFVIGFAYDAVKSRGFRERPVMIDFSES